MLVKIQVISGFSILVYSCPSLSLIVIFSEYLFKFLIIIIQCKCVLHIFVILLVYTDKNSKITKVFLEVQP